MRFWDWDLIAMTASTIALIGAAVFCAVMAAKSM